MTRQELLAFIAILLAAGKIHGNHTSVSELWTSHPAFRNPFFTAVMSRTRFQTLSAALRFDDKRTRGARIEETKDKLQAIREVFDIFVHACTSNYSPNEHLTVDERLATFRGKCPFRVYMKSKPGKYGIKIWVCADAKNGYLCNLQVYTGMIDNQREINQGLRVVSDMVEPYHLSGRGVTTDNFFTSIPLAEKLMDVNLTLVGTLRANKREIPAEFLPNSLKEEKSSLFGFTKTMTLVSYVPKRKKCVILLSTQHHDGKVEEDEDRKPIIIGHYNRTKGGVDMGDMMTRQYSCVRTTNRWPYRIFMEMVDIAALNAYILWSEKYPNWQKDITRRRKIFLEELIMNLAKSNIEERAINPTGLHLNVVRSIEAVGVEVKNKRRPIEAAAEGSSKMKTGKRCALCPRNEDRKTRLMCISCKKPVCQVHRKDTVISKCFDC